MGMAEIRDAFEAYASGELGESELRNALRAEIETQPGAVDRYAAMAAALRRRKMISVELEAAVVSDMNEIVARTGTPQIQAPAPTRQPAGDSTRASASAASASAASASVERVDGTRVRAPRVGTERAAVTRTSATRTSATRTSATRAGALPLSAPPAVAPPAPPFAQPVDVSRPSLPVGKGGAWDAQEKLAEPEAPVAVGSVLRERFELVEELGRGGMGVVYKAIDQREVENKGREPYVAIKVLNEEFKRHPESARALQRESKKSMRLAHPNIVLVRDFDRDHGNVYMVMELLHGTPLDQLVARQHPRGMPIEKVIEIVAGLGAALSYAHQQGIVHADFKPSNAFLTSQDAVKVLDFGVARVALALDRGESTLFDAGKLNAVSPAYASIELLIGEVPDPRDDIYALACVAYYLLTGRHPFNGIDALKARDSMLLPMPIPGLPDAQWRALRAALVFERWDRTPSVREFMAQFCTLQPRRSPNVVARASKKVATGASVTITRGTVKVADAAARRPWMFAAPAVLMLAIGLVGVLVHRRSEPNSATAPPSLPASPEIAAAPATATSAAASQPADPVTQLRARVAALNPATADFIDASIAASADIKALNTLAPSDSTLQRLRAQLQAAMASAVEAQLMRGDVSGAHRLVDKIAALLPPSMMRAYSSEAFSKRQALLDLMKLAEPTQRWADSVSAAIQDLAGTVPADDPLLRDAREMSDTTFELAAEEARDQGHRDEAREYLAVGMSVDPQSASLTHAALDIARDNEPSRAKPVAIAGTEPGRPSPPAVAATARAVATPAAAPAAAAAPLAVAAVGTSTVPRSAEAVLQRARQEMSQGDTEAALQTLAAGRQKNPGSQPLKDLEIAYDRVEEEVERINLAPSLNVRDHQEWLSEIRSLTGDDYAQIEPMLARALANDIADQRARADRPAVVSSLLASGRSLFPEYASLLEQGKASNTEDAAADPSAGATSGKASGTASSQ